MSAEHHPFAEAEAWLRDHRPHVIDHLERAMKYIDDLISGQKRLISERQAADQNAAAEKARADKAESALADLQAQVAADEDKAKAALDAVNAEVASEGGASGSTVPDPSAIAAQTGAPPAVAQAAIDAHTDPANAADPVGAAVSAATNAGADQGTAAAVASAVNTAVTGAASAPDAGATGTVDPATGAALPGQVLTSV